MFQRIVWALVAAVAVSGAVTPASAVKSGRGILGEWTLAWRFDDYDGANSSFRAVMGPEYPFPHRAVVMGVGRTRHLVFFDEDGRVASKVSLDSGEEVLPAGDGSAYLAWTMDAASRRLFNYRYHRRGQVEPDWEASTTGEPLLFSEDGSLFVVASADTGRDGFQRVLMQPAGNLQVVDGTGFVLGDYPIRPIYVRLTGDGARIAMLHTEEMVVLRADGRLDWTTALPVDAVLMRQGLSQLEAAGGVIAVTGTGEAEDSRVLQPKRHGTIHVFDDTGRPLWSATQPDDQSLWFQLSCALSSDGGTLATFHTDAREIVVQVWDARSGEPLWRRSLPRGSGPRCLSVAPLGELIVLASGDLRTAVTAWDREGSVVWDGTLLLPSKTPRISSDGLLISDRWIVRLTPEWPE